MRLSPLLSSGSPRRNRYPFFDILKQLLRIALDPRQLRMSRVFLYTFDFPLLRPPKDL